MKRLVFSVITLALTAGAALAADLPSRNAPAYLPPPPPPPLWTGFYVGLNAGYGWGATTNAPTVAAPLLDAVALGANALDPVNAHGGLIPGISALANTGIAHVNQNGFIGGGQIGYNWQVGSSFVLGLEADIQGSTIRGNGGYVGASQDSMYWVDPPPLPCSPSPQHTCTLSRTTTGLGQVTARIDWMGTVRGRLGYLLTPTLLVYGTGGLAYGGVQASAVHAAITQGTLAGLYALGPGNVPFPSPYNGTLTLVPGIGAGNFSETRVGWTAGGGFEWMFWPNWSVKAEALYYDLGSVALPSSPITAAAPIGVPANVLGPVGVDAGQVLMVNVPTTRVKFDGVVARAGINYHFNWGAPAPVVAKY
jgi:outer membrane immunogenic protein